MSNESNDTVSSPLSQLNFATNLWDKFEMLQKISSEKRKLIEDFTNILQERVEIEDIYSKGLEKLSYLLNNFIDKNLASLAFSSLQSYHMHRFEQSRELSKSIKTDVLECLKEINKNQGIDYKRLLTDGKKLEKELKNNMDQVEKQKNKYIKTCKLSEEAEMLNECVKLTKDGNNELKAKTQTKLTNLQKEKLESEQKYKYSLGMYNNNLDYYYVEMGKIQDTFQKHEEERIEKIKDSVMKIFVYEISGIRNLQYDIDKLTQVLKFSFVIKKIKNIKKIDLVDTKKDIQDFIKENKSDRNFLPRIKFEPYVSFINITLKYSNPSLDENPELTSTDTKNAVLDEKKTLFEQFPDYCVNLIKNGCSTDNLEVHPDILPEDREKSIKLSKIIQTAWTGSEEMSSENLKEFMKLIKDKLGRKLWTIHFQTYRIAGKFLLSDKAFLNIGKLTNQIFNTCFAEKDVTTAKKSMILSFTFYKNNTNIEEKKGDKEPEERIYLQNAIADHVIWKTLDFWECSIFESIKEELENQRNIPGTKNEKNNEVIIREKNIIFSQLASYAHNMLMFGMDPNLVKDLMTKFGKCYNLFDLQIKDLYINVDNFGKDPENMSKMKAMGLTFLYKDTDLKKKSDVTKIMAGPVNKRTLNFGASPNSSANNAINFSSSNQTKDQNISPPPPPPPPIEDENEKKKLALTKKMEFKSDIYGKKTHLKFEEKKPDFKAEFVPTKNEEMFFEVNLNRGVLKKTSNFYHENEDIISDSGNMKNYLNSHESNL